MPFLQKVLGFKKKDAKAIYRHGVKRLENIIKDLIEAGATVDEIMLLTGLSRSTVYRKISHATLISKVSN